MVRETKSCQYMSTNPDCKSSKGKQTADVTMRYEKFLENSCRMIAIIYPDMDSDTIHKRVFSHFDPTNCCRSINSVKKVLGEPLDDFLAKGVISEVLPLHYLKTRKEKVGCLATWAGLKKGMPDPCSCAKDASVESFVLRSKQQFVPDTNYLNFVYRTVYALFRHSINKRKYEAKVASNSPSFNGCTEGGRNAHGAFGVLDKKTMDFYSRGCLPITNFECVLDNVISSGKIRTLVKTPASWNALRPLHEVIYDRISQEDWLLRGEPSLSRVSRITKGIKKNEKFLSGDYESATDCLSIEVAEVILRAIKDGNKFCPEEVWQAAFKSLRPFIHAGKHGRYQPRRGQMMGSLLSFPLLCLQNYCATKYILGDRPMLINGDDLLTRATPVEYAKWLREVPKLGLKPSLGKCGFSRSFFTINSDYFNYSRYGARRLPFGRLKTLMKFNEGIPDHSAYLRARAGLVHSKHRVGFDRCWLDKFAGFLYKSRRPMRALGYTLVKCAIPNHLALREAGYEGVPVRDLPPCPSPRTQAKLHDWVFAKWKEIPHGIRMIQGPVWADLKERSRGEYRRMNDVWKEWWINVRLTGVNIARFKTLKPSLLPFFNLKIKKHAFREAGRVTRRLAGIEKELRSRPSFRTGIMPSFLVSKKQEFRAASAT